MDDTVSRQEAINALREYEKRVETVTQLCTIKGCEEIISKLPPAQPERKRGEWIKKMRVNETETYTSYDPEWYCSCCGTKYDSCVAKIINFCYVCGVDLREESDNG